MKITLVGAGAIGQLWGCQLEPNHSVQFWTRRSEPFLDIDYTALEPACSRRIRIDANNPTALSQADMVLITVKAFQVEAALDSILPHLSPTTPVIIMHNGMGTHSLVLRRLVEENRPQQPVLYATTSQAAFRPGHTQEQSQGDSPLQHTGRGQSWIGAVNDAGKYHAELAAVLDNALAPCQWHDDIFVPLWQKLAINCAINPLTAMHQCRNGELAAPQFSGELDSICQEVAAVMNAEGYPTSANTLRQQVENVILATAANYSSMNQDIHHHRPTEIDYITGYLVRRAQAHQLAVPTNLGLWQHIKRLEQHDHDQ